MLFAAINSGIEFGINYLPLDDEAKDWLKRANDGIAVAADVVVGGGTSTGAIVAKAVLREMGDRVVPADDKTAQAVFQAGSAVTQAAAGSVGSGVAMAATASSKAAVTSLAAQASAQTAKQVTTGAAKEALKRAAVEAAKNAATQVAGGAAGAGVGYAVDGTSGLQRGAQIGLSASSGDLGEAAFKAGGAAAGGAIGYAIADEESRFDALAAGATIGTRVGAASSNTANQRWEELLQSDAVGAVGLGASASARAAAGQQTDKAIADSAGVADLASSAAELTSSVVEDDPMVAADGARPESRTERATEPETAPARRPQESFERPEASPPEAQAHEPGSSSVGQEEAPPSSPEKSSGAFDLAGKTVSLASRGAAETTKALSDVAHEQRKAELVAAQKKHGSSEELRSKLAKLEDAKELLGDITKGLSRGSSIAKDSGSGLELGSTQVELLRPLIA